MIKLKEYLECIDAQILTSGNDPEDIKIEDGYVSDLLSDVMGSAKENQVWVTIMRHLNVVAVAALAGIPVIVFAKNIKPDKSVIDKANDEGICLISSPLSVFEISGKLYKLLNP